ncbi:hypothetical protein [Achromobacter dolens]|uniref:hypothetical protein n=1 Tax=Achromobacter dolens TaxID=1287738 RepID=UPI0031E0500F
MNKFTIFYSWQSDLPNGTNRNAIRNAIAEACIALTEEFDGVLFIQDEATRDMAGSPNIAEVVQAKIEAADVFVADITTITEAGAKRACANPNVMYELGYAAAYLGWERIILVFNKAYGDLANDIPFDIRQQRTTPYQISAEEAKKGAHKPLAKTLEAAIGEICKQTPKRPAETRGKSQHQIRHERDVKLITELMSSVARDALDDHLRRSPRCIVDCDFEMWEGFNGIASSSAFALNDATLAQLVERVHSSWGITMGSGHLYHQVDGMHAYDSRYVLSNPGDASLTERQQAVWDAKEAARDAMSIALKELLEHIRVNYVEVDLTITDHAFLKRWVAIIEQAKKDVAPV